MNLQISGIEYTKEKITFEKMYVEEFYRITCMHPKGLSALRDCHKMECDSLFFFALVCYNWVADRQDSLYYCINMIKAFKKDDAAI